MSWKDEKKNDNWLRHEFAESQFFYGGNYIAKQNLKNLKSLKLRYCS